MKGLLLLTGFLVSVISAAQPRIITPSPSPQQKISMWLGDDIISVDYSRIRLKGRKFFGQGGAYMFPYNKIWRTGANMGSKISFSGDVMIQDKILAKGSYVLLSWPGEKSWDISFYKDVNIGGNVDTYDKKKEAILLSVPVLRPEKTVETMTIALSRAGNNTGVISIAMENTLLKLPFSVMGDNNQGLTTFTNIQPVGIDTLSVTWAANYSQKIITAGESFIGFITTSTETEFGGEPAPAGKYSILLNTTDNKVRFKDDKGKDFRVTPFKAKADKVFDYKTNDLSVNFSHLPEDRKTALLRFETGDYAYTIPVTCEFDSKVMKMIADAVKSPSFNQYFTAAMYYIDNGKDLRQALEWLNKALILTPKGFWIVYQKANIYYALGEYSTSISTARETLDMSKEAGNKDYVKLSEELIGLAEKKIKDKGLIVTAVSPEKPGSGPAISTQEGNPASGIRLALVIGIKSYTGIAPLANTVNDAKDMSQTLQKLGFKVIELIDPKTKREIQDAVRRYYTELKANKYNVGLLFYSGHGLQIDGANYLIPAAVNLEIKADVEDQCVNMGYIMEALEEAKNTLNIFILDACRNSPFRSFDRSGEKGLSLVSAPAGSYIVYSTKPGSVASDGSGRNGLFTSSLLKYMSTPNINIEQVFKNVAREVIDVSNNTQRPWIASDYVGDFYFAR